MALEQIALGTLSADGSTAWIKVTNAMRAQSKGVHVRVTGTLGGGTITIEGSNNQSDAYGTGAAGVLTAPESAEVRLLAGEYIRATIAGSTTPSAAVFVLIPNRKEGEA